MTDDLLDEATRYGERFKNVPVGVMVLALVERVQQAEAVRNDYHHQYLDAVDARVDALTGRDAARGKLDRVRNLAHQPIGFRVNGSIEPVIRTRDVLAILDGTTGD
ncbi:hypothetical protein RDI86_02040 [Cellulosimicrobium sp. XJ-DQ-B-000]|uniref:hypothetical protein n=1 Tax=Cellulosimicrobium sp. XJ-DQ-B-000 TaxID=3072182 RepID=UPI002806FD9F|nr:hypothetical protein [Cellulosimicrobium sp. XJ-DQ-B-000]MDQ8040628.1 hypothetical protein [Cellulosimicrobium sp. XJ-DQ-B-000]